MADLDSVSTKRTWFSIPERFQLHGAMLALQFGYAGFHVISRAALNMGISKYVFPVYRNIIALLLLIPSAYFFEKKNRPPINFNFLCQFFFLALVGITANQAFYLLGLENTSPTFASAVQNSIPAITFLMAVILRIEKVKLNRKDGLAKVAGTIFCVIGATIITLYKGPTIYTPSSHVNNTSTMITEVTTAPMIDFWTMSLGDAKGKNWTLGCVYLFAHCLSWSGWLVFQTHVLKKYPARLSVTSYTCFFGLLQFLLIALVCERNSQAWLFNSSGEVFTILYVGVVATGIASTVQVWCIDRQGPVFVAVYQPVQTFVVAFMASIALGEEFYLGGIIGAILIVAGLYFVLWGKSEETKFAKEQLAIASSTTEHSNTRSTSVSKESSLNQPFLSSSTENV
ncbi:protein WALLS ARE THIN 1 [Lathyrus oleraceus]|uniref:WAT1-related protein n=1 Tax=Pisum sativum TaxID=3888 RepID=A0A9D5AIQ6_PEA|nr:protein WALLS ARE THIN 1-like [Pisum sativum]KAI5407105.1 WD repeat-containing protein wat1 [Pisum sativum]